MRQHPLECVCVCVCVLVCWCPLVRVSLRVCESL